jgi:hypothetical protein
MELCGCCCQSDVSLLLLSRGQGHTEYYLLRIEAVHSGSVPTHIQACDQRDAKDCCVALKCLVLVVVEWDL